MGNLLLAVAVLFALLVGWLAVQRWARRVRGTHDRMGNKVNEYAGCGCGSRGSDDRPEDGSCSGL